MGSPLAPSLANAFLAYHEKRCLEECHDTIKPLVYRRYVDDIFPLCRDEEHHKQFLDYMNTKHANMNFTEERTTTSPHFLMFKSFTANHLICF